MTDVSAQISAELAKLLQVPGVTFEGLIDDLGQGVVKQEEPKLRESRASRVAAWQGPKDLEGDDKEAIEKLPGWLGKGPTPETPRELTEAEIDEITEELLTVRHSQDILTGRHDAIRKVVFNALNVKFAKDPENLEPEFTPGSLPCPKFKVRLAREIVGGNAVPQWDKLVEVVTDEVWRGITNVVSLVSEVRDDDGTVIESKTVEGRQINQDKLFAALKDGRVTLDDLRQIYTLTPKSPRFHIRKLEDEARAS